MVQKGILNKVVIKNISYKTKNNQKYFSKNDHLKWSMSQHITI